MIKLANKQEINAAIALEIGWTCTFDATLSKQAEAMRCWVRPGNTFWQTEKLPNFCEDLNEMQKVFEWLCQCGIGSDEDLLFWEGRRDQYGYYLEKCGDNIVKHHKGGSYYIHMNLSAYNKAICFLKMINSESEIKKYEF